MLKPVYLLTLSLLLTCVASAQQITGYWQGNVGKIIGVKLALKLVLHGDSIVGTSYYYNGKTNYMRYSVRGYFDPKTNAVIWWDDMLLQAKKSNTGLFSVKGWDMQVEANFNCPGGGIMKLEGTGTNAGNSKPIGITLSKVNNTPFDDEWNVIIDNWLVGGNNPQLIDSIQALAYNKPENLPTTPIYTSPSSSNTVAKSSITNTPNTTTTTVVQPVVELNLPVPTAKPIVPVTTTEYVDLTKPNPIRNKPTTIQDTALQAILIPKPIISDTITIISNTLAKQMPNIALATPTPNVVKYTQRTKQVLTTLPMPDTTLVLTFYDNAEVDGDSVALFLDGVLVQEHIRLSDRPYNVILTKAQLSNAKELTMVAENLGSIPPNTSYMVTYIKGIRYDATLSSTEYSSAVIRFAVSRPTQ